jgi:hypothetical protein
LLKKGENVHAGEFGDEGSGGQSYLRYPWVAGKKYAFLIHAQPDPMSKTTVFTAFFKAVDDTTWQLMASFRRPQSGYFLKGLYSFLENFDPDWGNRTRTAFYGNQWVVDHEGRWFEVTGALYTGDATANIHYRKDYGGGIEKGWFYLRTGGFFNEFTPLRSRLERSKTSDANAAMEAKKLLKGLY